MKIIEIIKSLILVRKTTRQGDFEYCGIAFYFMKTLGYRWRQKLSLAIIAAGDNCGQIILSIEWQKKNYLALKKKPL